MLLSIFITLPQNNPFAIRYPRGKGVLENWRVPFEEIQIGKANIISEGEDIAIISIGHIGNMIIKITITSNSFESGTIIKKYLSSKQKFREYSLRNFLGKNEFSK